MSETILIYSVLGLAGTGVIAGILAGMLGVGGGIVIVPVLFWLLDTLQFPAPILMHMAVGTSLATIVPTSISSMRAHHKRGAVDVGLLKSWGPAIVIGAAIGGIAGKFIDANGLKLVFGFIALAVAINMALPTPLNIGDKMPVSRLVNSAISGMIGLLSALMGIGGGTLGVPTMVAFSYPTHRAVGTASAFGLLIALPALLGFIWSGWGIPGRPLYSLGFISMAAALVIFPMTVLFAPLGARLAHSINQRRLKLVFGAFLALTAAKMLYSVFAI